MSSQPIIDFLAKQLFIQRNIVTYRLLSREFSLHINVAKNELAVYHANAPYQSQTCSATYQLSGEAILHTLSSTLDSDDVNMLDESDSVVNTRVEDDSDDVPRMKVMLVNEKDLETAKLSFERVNSIYIYSLSPSPVKDGSLLCAPTEIVREIDGKKGTELAKVIGKVIGSGIEVKTKNVGPAKKPTAAPVAGPSMLKPDPALVPNPVVATAGKDNAAKEEEPKAEADKSKEKQKQKGKIEFFKAKPKETKVDGSRKAESPQVKPEPVKKQFFTAKPTPPVEKAKDVDISREKSPKRGIKRKSVANSPAQSENESGPSKPPSKAKNGLRVQKGVILSDDESDDISGPRRKSKAAPVESQAEKDAQALMDIDDDEVIRVSRHSPTVEQDDGEEGRNNDVEMDDDTAPKATKPKVKRQKKVPVGKNGLKKKRVMKSRSTKDSKGYDVMEDYSSYESVDEEQEPATNGSIKAKKSSVKTAPSVKKSESEDMDILADSVKPAPLKRTNTRSTPATKAASSKGAPPKGQKGGLHTFFKAK